MPRTPRLPYTETLAVVPVVGLRVVGKEHVYRFADCQNKNGTICIGRTRSRKIRIRKDDFVSELHAFIHKNTAGQWEIVDSRSTNGVKVSERAPYFRYRAVKTYPLSVGLRIKVGHTKLVIVGPDGEPVIAAARLSHLGRVAFSVFGSVRALAERLGVSRRQAEKMAHRRTSRQPEDSDDE